MHILIMEDKKTRQEQELGDGLLSELSSLDGVDLIYGFDYTQGCIASSDYGLLAFLLCRDCLFPEVAFFRGVSVFYGISFIGRGSVCFRELSSGTNTGSLRL